MAEAINNGIFGLGGALIVFFGNIHCRAYFRAQGRQATVRERLSAAAQEFLQTCGTPHRRDRAAAQPPEGSKKAKGIKLEFRGCNEENSNDHIEMTAMEAEH